MMLDESPIDVSKSQILDMNKIKIYDIGEIPHENKKKSVSVGTTNYILNLN